MHLELFSSLQGPLADVDLVNLSKVVVPVVGIVFGCGIPIAIVVSALYFRHSRARMWHETARIALEKGQPIPTPPPGGDPMKGPPPSGSPWAEWHRQRHQYNRWRDLRGGLILLAIGLAIYLSGIRHGDFFRGGSLASYILIGLGLAKLLIGVLTLCFSHPSDDTPPRPPET
jgi:hypothetical protein